MKVDEAIGLLTKVYNHSCAGFRDELEGKARDDIAVLIQSLQAENTELQAEVVRLTIENCRLIKISMYDGLGKPELIEEMCFGYAGDTDEPHIDCQCCKAFYGREEDE